MQLPHVFCIMIIIISTLKDMCYSGDIVYLTQIDTVHVTGNLYMSNKYYS